MKTFEQQLSLGFDDLGYTFLTESNIIQSDHLYFQSGFQQAKDCTGKVSQLFSSDPIKRIVNDEDLKGILSIVI